MTELNFVTERIALGAAPYTIEDIEDMVDVGITHVLDCRSEYSNRAIFEDQPIQVLINGIPDWGYSVPSDWFHESIEYALRVLAQKHTKLYIHCAGGIHRGPSTCYAVIRALGLSSEDAERMIYDARPIADLIYKEDAEEAVKELYI